MSIPYTAVKTYYNVEEFVMGNTHTLVKKFRWDKIILNLPGGDFNPAIAIVLKYDVSDEHVAIGVLIYVYDLGVTALTRELAWVVT